MAVLLFAGRKDRRLEAAIDRELDAVLYAMARRIAGDGNPRNFRSEAARQLIAKGAATIPGLMDEARAILAEWKTREESSH
ncbi:MAG TPA: hypothetical protein VFU47_14320 [Armatimonadota bacterium]|nr:hypothetical protein [Armatimonadota bacterium]